MSPKEQVGVGRDHLKITMRRNDVSSSPAFPLGVSNNEFKIVLDESVQTKKSR